MKKHWKAGQNGWREDKRKRATLYCYCSVGLHCPTITSPVRPVTAMVSNSFSAEVLCAKWPHPCGNLNAHLRTLINLLTSATSHWPLRSIQRLQLFVPRARTAMTRSRGSFATVCSSLWRQLSSSHDSLLQANIHIASFRLFKDGHIFSLWKCQPQRGESMCGETTALPT